MMGEDRCWGGCKTPSTRIIGQEWLHPAVQSATRRLVVLHDLDRCPQGAAVAVAQKKKVFERGVA